jgi:hypothetical protein
MFLQLTSGDSRDPLHAAQRVESVRLPPAVVERQHKQAPRLLAERMLTNEQLEVADHRAAAPSRKTLLEHPRRRDRFRLGVGRANRVLEHVGVHRVCW